MEKNDHEVTMLQVRALQISWLLVLCSSLFINEVFLVENGLNHSVVLFVFATSCHTTIVIHESALMRSYS